MRFVYHDFPRTEMSASRSWPTTGSALALWMQPPRQEASTALMPRDALRDLIVASSPEDSIEIEIEPPPLYLVVIAIVAALLMLFIVIIARF